MDQLRIRGGIRLRGKIEISGAKNAALPLMVASLLTADELVLHNIPDLADIRTIARLLDHHGTNLKWHRKASSYTVEMRSQSIDNMSAPYDLVRKMRASVLVLGALVARCREAKVSLPGGCAIGTRPIDIHLLGLERLGARIELQDGYVIASAPDGLVGCDIRLPKVSVGATENLMMAACLASGETILDNVAQEPEISDLAKCLVSMGADIRGAGSNRIKIQGVKQLHGADHVVIPDRIEAGTYAVAAAITGGEIELRGVSAQHLKAILEILEGCGVSIKHSEDVIIVSRSSGAIYPAKISTEPYPGFPTDMQAQILALLTLAEGTSTINENIFENRFMHVPELMRMGADILQQGSSVTVRGVKKLRGAPVMATDLRASVSLVLAALVAEEETTISRIYHLDRGYERLVEKLRSCGANIERLS